jgi:hypothetical protein
VRLLIQAPDHVLSIDGRPFGVCHVAVMLAPPFAVGLDFIEHATRGLLRPRERFVQRINLRRDRHFQLLTLLTFIAAGPLVDFDLHPLAAGRLGGHIERPHRHIVRRRRAARRRRAGRIRHATGRRIRVTRG